MRRIFPVLVTFLLLVIPAELFAKAGTSKIKIKGVDLKSPIEITDPKTLANFSAWTGPGTSCTGAGCPGVSAKLAESFIVDWSKAVAEPPSGLQRYEVSFYAKTPNERLIYVVFYEYDPATEHGYIYLPGRTEEWYWLNMSTIFHGVEGKWFHAWSEWDKVATPLILKATSYPHVISQPPSIFDIFADPPFPPADLPLTVPLHARPDAGGHASLITPPHELHAIPPLESRTVFLPAFGQSAVCYSIRSYRVTRDDPESDSTRLAGYSTCQPAVRFHVKDAEDSPVQARFP